MKDKLSQAFLPNRFRGHAVMLGAFILGLIYFITIMTGFSAALGLTAGLITAPIGFLAGAATIYIVRKAVNLEIRGLKQEAKHNGIELSEIPSLKAGDLLETSKELYKDKQSWKVVLISLAKFPIGIASFTFITAYLSLSLTLIASPIIGGYYKAEILKIGGNIINTPLEFAAATFAGVVIFIVGSNATEKLSKIYMRLNSEI
ncbi:MAG: sensor domain-containing protein [Candidatus Magasanikbacteria bacterium]